MPRKRGYYEVRFYAIRRLNLAIDRFLNTESHSEKKMATIWASGWIRFLERLRFLSKEGYEAYQNDRESHD